MKTFRLSQRYVNYSFWPFLVGGLLFVCMKVFWLFAQVDFDLDRFNRIFSVYDRGFFAIAYAVLFGVFLFAWYVTRQLLKRKYRLELGPENMVLSTGITRSESAWGDIGKVKILTNAKGRPITIKIWSTSFNRPLRLAGLEDMSGLVRTIRSSLPSSTSIETGRDRLHWGIPLVALLPLVASVVSVALLESSRRFGWSEFEFLGTFLLICAVVFYLFKRPISKADPDYAMWEVIIAALFLIAIALLLWGWIR